MKRQIKLSDDKRKVFNAVKRALKQNGVKLSNYRPFKMGHVLFTRNFTIDGDEINEIELWNDEIYFLHNLYIIKDLNSCKVEHLNKLLQAIGNDK